MLRGEAVLIVTGPRGAGKTSAALELASRLRSLGVTVGGVVSPRLVEGGRTVGYLVRNLATGEERPLCSRRPPGVPFRRYYFSPEGLEFADRALAAAREARVAVVDEVGPLELSGGGFASGIFGIRGTRASLVITVRPALVERVREWLVLPGDTRVLRVAPRGTTD